MAKQMRLILAAATLSAISAVGAAQTTDSSTQNQTAIQAQQAPQQQPAPIEHAYPNQYGQMPHPMGPPQRTQLQMAPGQTVSSNAGEATARPARGVLLRIGPQAAVREVSSDAGKLELAVEHGIVNVNVHDPAKDMLILVDLPGGQTQVLKNGLYTFNADTNTARVLQGEALAFPASEKSAGEKPLKVKEQKMVVFSGSDVRPESFDAYDARADLLPGAAPGYGDYGGAYGGGYGFGPYGDGFYGDYPYWAYDAYPYWGYPYGYGWYPWGVGLGFTYFGGWGGFHHGWGGFHGGGFHGGGFHGGRR